MPKIVKIFKLNVIILKILILYLFTALFSLFIFNYLIVIKIVIYNS